MKLSEQTLDENYIFKNHFGITDAATDTSHLGRSQRWNGNDA